MVMRRMTTRDPNREGISALYALIVVGVQWYFGGFAAPWSVVILTPLALTAGVFGWALVRVGLQAWRVRRFVHDLRRLGPSERDAVVEGFGSGEARKFLEAALSTHGEIAKDGAIERFRYSPVDQRELLWLRWCAWVAVVPLALLAGGVLSAPLPWRVAAGVAAACMLVLSVVIGRSLQAQQRELEISPFGLAVIEADGTRRRIAWPQALWVRNRPWRRQVEVRAVSGDLIGVDYRLVGSDRALRLIVEYGQFEPEARS